VTPGCKYLETAIEEKREIGVCVMGVERFGKGEDKKKRKGRGSVNNKSRLQAFASGRGDASADWGGCDAKKLQAVIVAITELGGAITLGLSRDGGAYSLTLLLDQGRETLWFNGGADLDEELTAVKVTLDMIT